MRVALLMWVTVAGLAQQPQESAQVLARARSRLAEAAAKVPKYTCTQTVDRSYFRQTRQAARTCDAIVAGERNGRSKLSLSATDRLRFDVEVADGGYEIYAWPGAARIETEKVEDMAGGGPLGTGPFGPFLVDIFSNSGAQFLFLREKNGGGVRLFEYRYRVPLEASHYRIQAGAKWRTSAYDGTFLLDSDSAELKELTVRTDELASDTGSCEATTTMAFTPLRIGGGEYLIPGKTLLRVVRRDAGATENSTVYSACHEFSAESAVRFDAPISVESHDAKLGGPVRTASLPPGLPVEVVLDAEIDTDRAAAGDPVTAKTGKPVVDPATRRVLLPGGTPLRGRINHLEHHVEGEKYFLVGLSFETLAIILDATHQLNAEHLDRPTLEKNRGWTTESHSGFRGGGTLVFHTAAERYVVPRGHLSHWITIPVD